MQDIEIPRDIRKYESKLIGPFTTRQTIFFAIAAGLVLIAFNLLRDKVTTDTLFGICFFLATPPILFGFFKPYGMTPEKFLLTAFVSNVLSPKNRLYKSELYYSYELGPEELLEKNEHEKRYKKAKKTSKKKVEENFEAFK